VRSYSISILKGKPLSCEIDIKKLAHRTDGYVGADIEAICHEAAK